MNEKQDKEASLSLKSLVLQLFVAGFAQDAIAAYVGKSKTDINALLRPLQKKEKSKR